MDRCHAANADAENRSSDVRFSVFSQDEENGSRGEFYQNAMWSGAPGVPVRMPQKAFILTPVTSEPGSD